MSYIILCIVFWAFILACWMAIVLAVCGTGWLIYKAARWLASWRFHRWLAMKLWRVHEWWSDVATAMLSWIARGAWAAHRRSTKR